MNLSFWLAYFSISQSSVASTRVTPLLTIDEWIPFWPGAAPVYLSQFLTLPMLILLIDSRDELLAFFLATALLSAFCFLLFALVPTEMPRPESSLAQHYYFYGWIAANDTTRNAFPSLHAGFGMLSSALALRVFGSWSNAKALCVASWTMTCGVLIAALVIKQHSVSDILAGCGIGALIARQMLRAPEKAAILCCEEAA